MAFIRNVLVNPVSRQLLRHPRINNAAISSIHTTSSTSASIAPLTFLTDEETMMKESVSRLAKEKIAPLVKKMDQEHKLEQSVIDMLFENGSDILGGVELEH